MALSHRATGTWTELTADGAVAIPAGATTGDRMFLFASWKDFSVTADVSGWTEVTEFADGAVAVGNGTGSMKVGCWYKDHSGSESNPTLDFSVSPNIAAACMLVFQKAASDGWDAPSFVTAALSWTTSATTTNASSTVTVPSGGVVVNVCGIRDDSATFTRGVSGVDAASGVTWNGNYVEAPATHHSTTTANDMAADLGYRLVTTGGAGITLRATGTLTAAETGASLWVVQGVHTDTTVTPGVLALTTATFAPAATVTNNQLVTPGVLAATLATFAPSVATTARQLVTPGVAALTTTAFAPSLNLTVTPGTTAATLTTFAPAATSTANVVATPALATLTTSTFAPVVGTPRLVTPDAAALTLTGFAPTAVTPVTVTPDAAALTITTFAPGSGTATTVTPGTAALTVATFAPDVATPVQVTPGTSALVTTAFAPSVDVGGGSVTVTPPPASLVLTTFAPSLGGQGDVIVTPGTLGLFVTGLMADLICCPPAPRHVATIRRLYAQPPTADGPKYWPWLRGR